MKPQIERAGRLELPTSDLEGQRSTTELCPRLRAKELHLLNGARMSSRGQLDLLA